MLRRVTYRTALNAFVFTGLWLVIGAIVMWTPIPGALGIAGGFFVAWLLLFFAVLAVAGAALSLAALNDAFPPPAQPAPKPRAQPAVAAMPQRPARTLWAPDPEATAPHSGQPGSAQRPRSGA